MQTFAPFGLRFVGATGTHGNELRAYPLPNGAACPALGRGSPVKMSGGVITSVGTGGDAPILGVANGFQWIDPATKQPQIKNAIPAATSSAGTLDGETRPVAFVTDNPGALYMIQATASLTVGDVGLNFAVTAVGGDVNEAYGTSKYAILATSRTSAITGSVKVLGLAKIDGNAWADPFTTVIVRVNRSILTEASAF